MYTEYKNKQVALKLYKFIRGNANTDTVISPNIVVQVVKTFQFAITDIRQYDER